MPYQKYKPFPFHHYEERTWPSKKITKAPRWCSVDLRDGNQSLILPMSIKEKINFFNMLVKIGFKEIEIGFPSASETEFKFLRTLIEQGIPEDVTIQVLTQCREHLIEKTFQSLEGSKNSVIHFYNSTSELQRRVVFEKDKNEIKKIATDGASLIKEYAQKYANQNINFQYSPESFSGTEVDFALEVCDAVIDIIKPTKEKPLILNLPATVEIYTPNVYADTIEYFISKITKRDSVVISTHNHNDRGTAVAATELSLLAGVERVEGTLFGNGERTGNVDLVTLALNMMSQGVDPRLDFSNLPEIIDMFESVNKIPVHVRHPYAGELVYTAFSGSHQDAINKGLKYHERNNFSHWEVPYLPIDPKDVGRTYETLVRINSQSGKGGIAYIMEREYKYLLPKEMHPDFGAVIQKISDETGGEIVPELIYATFKKEYLQTESPLKLMKCDITEVEKTTNAITSIAVSIVVNGDIKVITGEGNGPVDAFTHAVRGSGYADFKIHSYSEHAMGEGADAKAVSYVSIIREGKLYFGVGEDSNIAIAPIKAVVSALNRSHLFEK